MKKYLFIFTCALLAIGSTGCGRDSIKDDMMVDNNITRNDSTNYENTKADSPNLFLGKWKLVSIEDKGTVSDYTGDNSTLTFYEDGRFAYTPYTAKGVEGEILGVYESSESLCKNSYEYTEEELYIHNLSNGLKDIYTYVFSDNNETLRIVLTKTDEVGENYGLLPPPASPMLGKTQVFKKQY